MLEQVVPAVQLALADLRRGDIHLHAGQCAQQIREVLVDLPVHVCARLPLRRHLRRSARVVPVHGIDQDRDAKAGDLGDEHRVQPRSKHYGRRVAQIVGRDELLMHRAADYVAEQRHPDLLDGVQAHVASQNRLHLLRVLPQPVRCNQRVVDVDAIGVIRPHSLRQVQVGAAHHRDLCVALVNRVDLLNRPAREVEPVFAHDSAELLQELRLAFRALQSLHVGADQPCLYLEQFDGAGLRAGPNPLIRLAGTCGTRDRAHLPLIADPALDVPDLRVDRADLDEILQRLHAPDGGLGEGRLIARHLEGLGRFLRAGRRHLRTRSIENLLFGLAHAIAL